MGDGVFRSAVAMEADEDSPEIFVYAAGNRYYFQVRVNDDTLCSFDISSIEWARMKDAVDNLVP